MTALEEAAVKALTGEDGMDLAFQHYFQNLFRFLTRLWYSSDL